MEIRIGVTQSPREVVVEVSDDAAVRDQIKSAIDAAMKGATDTLWLTDKKGREIAIAGIKIAYVELGSPEGDRKIGFGG